MVTRTNNMLLIHIYTSFSTTEPNAVAYTLASHCCIYPMYPPRCYSKRVPCGELPIESPSLNSRRFHCWSEGAGCPSNISMLRYNDEDIIMPNDPMVWIGIYWSAALLQHIFLKSVTCQAHSHHAKLFSSSVNGTRNLQYRGHMRP